MADAPRERLWERGFEGHERAQLLRLAKLPLADKLDWLEQAQRSALALAAARVSRRKKPRQDPPP